jgi:hypothetical protein
MHKRRASARVFRLQEAHTQNGVIMSEVSDR